MKKLENLATQAMTQPEMERVRGGAYNVSFLYADGSSGFIVTDVVNDIRIGGPAPRVPGSTVTSITWQA